MDVRLVNLKILNMELVLICSLIANFFFAYPEVKKLYLKVKNKNKTACNNNHKTSNNGRIR